MGCSLGEGSKDWSGACAAVFEGGAPRVVENENGGRVTPSVVALADDGEALVGLTAKKLLFSSRATAVYGHQLLLGRAFESRETEALLAATKVSESVSRPSTADGGIRTRANTRCARLARGADTGPHTASRHGATHCHG